MGGFSYPHLDAVHIIKPVGQPSGQHISPSRGKSAAKERCKACFLEFLAQRHVFDGYTFYEFVPERSIEGCIDVIGFCLESTLHHVRHHPRHDHIHYYIYTFSGSGHIVRVERVDSSRPDFPAAYVVGHSFGGLFLKIYQTDLVYDVLSRQYGGA